ncbi:MAG: FAD-binding protein, partial [bacterium]
PKENLVKTLANYEKYCEAGVDEEFGKEPEKLLPLGDGPYYAMKGYSAVFSTVGGLDVDTKLNVLKDDGKTPINGLYAVGNDSGGVLYSNKKPYVTYGGAALGWAFTSGRLAGGNAVEYITASAQ